MDRFLFRYRLTPHTTMGEPPAVLLMGRLPHSRLDILRSDVGEWTQQRQEQQRYQHNRTNRERTLGIGQPVFLIKFGTGEPWVTGTVEEQTRAVSYTVHLPDDRIVRRHLDHLRNWATQDEAGGETEALVDRTQHHTSQRQDPGQESIDMKEAERTKQSELRQSRTGGKQGTTQQESPPKAGEEQCRAREEIQTETERASEESGEITPVRRSHQERRASNRLDL